MKKTMLSAAQSYLVCALGVLAAFGVVAFLCETGLADYYIKGIMMTACIAIIMTTSLNLTIGVLGQLTLGCCGFQAIGAYVAALASKLMIANGMGLDPTTRFLITTLLGGVVACVFGILIGIPALRLHGDYLAIITLGFGEIIRVVIQNLKVAGGMGLDQGAAGQALIGIDRTANLYVVFWIMVVSVAVLFMFGRSRYGRAVKAIRDDEIAAGASGLNTTYLKVLVFAISAFFAGIAGGIFAQYIGSLNPSMAGWLNSINYVIMVVFGGMGSITGSIVSAVGLTILPELLRAFAEYRMLVYSVVLVLVMIFRPQGIFGSWEFSLPQVVNRLLLRNPKAAAQEKAASEAGSETSDESGAAVAAASAASKKEA
ncbi:branched-chain amino acid ABC transporter permease [Bifidobacterium samirii]|uniref:Branched-chain amino acid ABC transporter permease n=1 Tax=Bifidobacterium samirii TaxID=2306974 RepID=A0A430FX08_9BIFI|nr:branched-chain amino acid ABC transporter permease [Bifidobacterium samirii]RSX58816.1 branched-chain amino acid ABC transporter permease [Bifidobacterium samirii]